MGTIEQLGDRWNLSTELLNISNKGIGPQEATWLTIPDPRSSLELQEPYEMARTITTPAAPKSITLYRAGVNATTFPQCVYCPPPLYTDEARAAKYQADVILEVTVEANGRADDIRVTKGVPYGLNEQAIKAVSQWKFRPATNGKDPVAVVVPIEISFRLY